MATPTPTVKAKKKSGAAGLVSVPAPANCVQVCAPDKDMLRPGQFVVNDINKMEAITQPLYSYQSYPAAGSTNLTFFQTPASGTVTAEDTNMQLAAQLPAPQKFLIQGIGIDYLPGNSPFVGPRADASTSDINDFYAIMRRGVVSLVIGAKQYLQVSPLMMLPPRSHLGGVAALATNMTTGANTQSAISFGFSDGDVYKPAPLLLEAGQNFRVDIGFSTAVAIPSGDTSARIGVILYGTLYRSPQ